MSRRIALFLSLNLLLICGVVFTVSAQEGAAKGKGKVGGKGKVVAARPGLFFKEVWTNPSGGEHPITQADIANADLEMTVLNNHGEGMQVTGVDGQDQNPTHLFTGTSESPTAIMFKHKTKMANMTGLARIKANIKTSGFHQVRPVVRLANGNYYVADQGVGTFTDWLNYEWAVGDLKWLQLDPAAVVTKGTWATPDLSQVDAIGFADLMPGSGHGAGGWMDIAQIEVYAASVDR